MKSLIKKVEFIRVEYSVGTKQGSKKFHSYQKALDFFTELRETKYDPKTDSLEMYAFGKNEDGVIINNLYAKE